MIKERTKAIGASFRGEASDGRRAPCHPRASGDPGRAHPGNHPFKVSYKSAHSGLKLSISSNFH